VRAQRTDPKRRIRLSLDYDEVYSLSSGWSFLLRSIIPRAVALPGIGTGLTHLASAANRDAMHAAAAVTDSMRMYHLGVERGRPEPEKPAPLRNGFIKAPARSCAVMARN